MFSPIPKKRFPEIEEQVLAFWQVQKIFAQSIDNRKGAPLFVTYDGPPFATGLPHYGHFLAGTIKDVVLRFKTMEGFYVPRRFGWDCHGLPIESLVEKEKGLSGAASIEEYGIAKFNEACRSNVLKYVEEWQQRVHRMGRWVDFKDTYHTMDKPYMESVWWVFKQLFDKDLVYEGFRVMPFSAKLGTPLSNFEAGENYQEVNDPSLFVLFQSSDDPHTSFLAWTTTPWTLVSNLALMVAPNATYIKVRDHHRNKLIVLAKSRLDHLYASPDDYDIVEEITGQQLVGKRYTPLFPYFKDNDAFRILGNDEVSMDDGSGIVHCAPAFGEIDFEVCGREGIDLVCPVDENGLFTDSIAEYQGLFVKDCDKDITKRLKSSGHLFSQGTIRHRYPMCPRTDTPLIYKVVSTWFVKVEQARDKLLANNDKIHWTPGHIQSGRFGKWLEQARDWNIARSRYFGTPIPLWRSSDGDLLAIGTIQELEELTGAKVEDLHRHFVDHLTIEKDGKVYHRIPEVFDCWFESGSMPYAENHYPFDHQDLKLPCDFIAEGLDQTRGWFYSLNVLSTLLFDTPAYKNCIVNGMLLAENGQKMSKRLKNYPEPMDVVHKYGADAIRLYMLHSPAVKADDLRFSEGGVELVMRQILLPFWHAFSFLVTYATIYDWKPTNRVSNVLIDKWIVSMTHKLIKDVKEGMDEYELSKAVEPFVGFIEELTNWYIRLNRRRFWESEDQDAFNTLYTVLMTLTKIAAPYIPFLSEAIFRHLRQETDPESVHLCDFPLYDHALRDERLEAEMAAAQKATSLGHALRKSYKIKTRQPLHAVHIASADPKTLAFLEDQKHLIASELNVKEVFLESDETAFVELNAKPNFRTLGKKVGKLMRACQERIDQFSQGELEALKAGQSMEIIVGGETVTLTPDDVEVERKVRAGMEAINDGEITVVLDTRLDEELIIEGLARELINKISTMRRDLQLDYVDRIAVKLDTTEKVQQAVVKFSDVIMHEVLATEITFGHNGGQTWTLSEETCTIDIQKTQKQ